MCFNYSFPQSFGDAPHFELLRELLTQVSTVTNIVYLGYTLGAVT